MQTQISIIVPVYNTKNTLNQCIENLINQTLPSIEIIMINDGSTDNSGKICDSFTDKDKRIKVIHQQNRGQAAARNSGIRAATGEYIGFVDSDDTVDPDMFRSLYEQATKSNTEIAACNFERITPEGRQLQYCSDKETIEFSKHEAMAEIFNNQILTFSCWNKIYKRELFDDIRFREGMLFEDIDICYRLIDKASKIVWLNKPLYKYQYNNQSSIRGGFDLRHLDEQKALNNMHQFYVKNYPKLADLMYYRLFYNALVNYTLIKINLPDQKDNYKYLIDFDKKILWSLLFNINTNLKQKLFLFLGLLLPESGSSLFAFIKRRRT